jgi:mono/diheme cytochrome c family protein
MIDNEFSVASRGTAFDPWFALDPAEHGWLATLGVDEPIAPEAMRRAVFEFLTTFTPDPNPATLGRDRFTKRERRGAEVFAQHCETCHQARLRSDDPESRVVPESWPAYIFGTGAVLWASEQRVKAGVEPYVHAEGARVPSLRRLWVKRPYFTNGTAGDLDAVLVGCDLGPPFSHVPGASAQLLTVADQQALRAFLDLL